jgi:hypothetical protein
MHHTKLEKKTAKIVSKMFTGRAFDVTKLDKYFTTHKVDLKLLHSLHNYIATHIGEDTFIFTDVFDSEFQKHQTKES